MKVFTGTVPFSGFQPVTSIVWVRRGERPPRPTDPTMTDDVWALMQEYWAQDPQSRPEMSGVLQGLASSLLQSLYQFAGPLPQFQVALNQFYDNTERGHCVGRLCDIELKKFINFLDNVRPFLCCLHPKPIATFRIGVTYRGVRWRVTTANIAQPTGGLQRAGHISGLSRDSVSTG